MSNRSSWRSLAGWLRLGLVLMGLAVLLPARAQTVIEAVSSAVQGGVEVVRISLSQPLTAAPTGFAIQAPARIALDFPGVTSALAQPTVEVNQGNVRSISVAQAGDRSRVVLNLKQAATYKTQLEGKTLLVILEPTVAVAPTRTTPAPVAFAGGAAGQALKDVDFRRGLDGVGRIVVTLPNAQLGVGLQQQGQALIAEFPGATLPEGLRRRMDVTDFGTPVQTVTTFQVADRVRMVIEPKGQWEHSAYQSDEQFVIEVKPLKVEPNKLSPGVGYTGQKLSLNFQNIEVRSLLQVIADFTNFNVVTSDSVAGSVTLRLQDVPWDQALDIILQAKGLGVRKAGNVLWIAPKDEIIAKEKLERESNVALESLEPLSTQSFQLNYAKALDVQRGLIGGAPMPGGAPGGGASSRILSPRGSVIAESRTNQLFITDVGSKLEQIRQLIAKVDVPVRQVLIEARIVEASDSFGKSLGARLGGGSTGQIASAPSGGEVRGALGSYLNPETNKLIVTPGFNTNFVNLASTGALGFGNPGALAFSIFSPDRSTFLNLEISALEADGKGKVVASPRVVTADKVKAIIEQGTELPYQMATASGATSVAFRKANLKLEVTPQITPEGGVILTLDVTKDSVGQSTPAGFAIDTKHISTEVLVENGGTVMIGGIYSEESTDTEAKVPFFGDLPVLGALFRTKSTAKAKKEMLMFITPKTVAERAAVR